MKEMKVLLGVSNRHLHLSKEDMDVLFGAGSELHNIKDLGQPGQYACEEIVTIEGPKGSIGRVRVLGPFRPVTQVEISITDSFKLGVVPVVRDSGMLDGTSGIKLIGPEGEVNLAQGVIVASRHVHFHTSEAEEFGVTDKQHVTLITEDEDRPMVYGNVLVRVSDNYAAELHLDVDEANAGLLKTGMMLTLRK